MTAYEALTLFLENTHAPESVLNIGDVRSSKHNQAMIDAGLQPTTISLSAGADLVGDYMETPHGCFDHIWCSHCLEHQRNPGAFLDDMFADLKDGGVLCITVPPARSDLRGGHVTIWNEAVLVYQLLLAGFNCRNAVVWQYGYNISCMLRKDPVTLEGLAASRADLGKIAPYLPDELRGR